MSIIEVEVDEIKKIEEEFFDDDEYEGLSTKEKINIVGNELLRIEAQQEELKEREQKMIILYEHLVMMRIKHI